MQVNVLMDKDQYAVPCPRRAVIERGSGGGNGAMSIVNSYEFSYGRVV
jgi:hypothetical protein